MSNKVEHLVILEEAINNHLGRFLPNNEDRHEATYDLAYTLSEGISGMDSFAVEDLINKFLGEFLGEFLVNNEDRHEETYELAYLLANNKY